MELADRVKTARKARGMSQEQLARRADLSLAGVSIIEQGQRKDPHLSTLSKIAGAMDMTVGELLGEFSGIIESEEQLDELIAAEPWKRAELEKLRPAIKALGPDDGIQITIRVTTSEARRPEGAGGSRFVWEPAT